jgi:hypothetical protein
VASVPVAPPTTDISGKPRNRGRRILVAAAAVLVVAVSVPIAVKLLHDDNRPAAAIQPPASAGPSTPACGFTEDFAGSALDPAWRRTRPDLGLTIGGDAADLDSPDGTDVYQANLTAPMLLRPVTGDFVLETTMQASPVVFYQGAGLLLFNGPKSYVRMERGWGGAGTVGFEYRDGGPHKWVHGPLPSEHPIKTEVTRLVFRMVRTGATITGSWRPVDKPGFTQLASVHMSLPETVPVGVSVINRAQYGAKPTPFHARFEQITVTC